MLARATDACSIVELGTSFGISTLHLAAALRDNGGGRIIGTEFEASKIAQAQPTISAACLADLVEIRSGDALQTGAGDLPDPIDLVLLDGAKSTSCELRQRCQQHPTRKRSDSMADSVLQKGACFLLPGWCAGQEGLMEHRLGSRHAIDLDVYLRTWGSTVSARGRLKDLSVSGAFISTQLPCRPLLQVTIQIPLEGQRRRNAPLFEAQIVRLAEGGIGIEWAELQPELVARCLLVEDADERMRANSTQWM